MLNRHFSAFLTLSLNPISYFFKKPLDQFVYVFKVKLLAKLSLANLSSIKILESKGESSLK